MSAPGEVTELLELVRAGDEAATEELYRRVYTDLHRVAGAVRRRMNRHATLQTTELVNEVYLRMAGASKQPFVSRAHFISTAAKAMRTALIDLCRFNNRQKRKAEGARVPLEGVHVQLGDRHLEMLDVDQAIDALSEVHERSAKVAQYRLLFGLNSPEIAELLGVSQETAQRDWRYAAAWLTTRLSTDA